MFYFDVVDYSVLKGIYMCVYFCMCVNNRMLKWGFCGFCFVFFFGGFCVFLFFKYICRRFYVFVYGLF